jgi:hypothetical protein
MRLGRGMVGAMGLPVALGLACGPQAAPAPARPAAAAPSPASPSPASAAPASPAQLDTLKVAFAADAAVYAPMFIAIEKG